MGITLNGATYAKMIQGGAALLYENRETINNLNVFPIPDGDTGDNMYMTISAGAESVKDALKLCDVAKASERAMLLGARGNSGVILSRIFSGLSKGFQNITEADDSEILSATELSIAEAYGAVSHPVDGTILSVYRDGIRYANENISEISTMSEYVGKFLEEARRSLDRTPEELPVLKEAGVIDSGGAGIVAIFSGMKDALDGKFEVNTVKTSGEASKKDVDITKFTEDSVIGFGYCTEFLLRLTSSKTGNVKDFDESVIKDYLISHGDSLVFFRDESIIKIHVHTKTPGEILNYCQKFGEFLTMKIENMDIQHTTKLDEGLFTDKTPKKRYGIVTVAAGVGMKKTFADMGADAIIDGGQSMNPSSADFVNAYKKVNAETIFVFPNNSNIILAANQSKELYTEAEIVVIESKTLGEGYVAISAVDQSEKDSGVVIESINEAMAGVTTATVSKASRDTLQSGIEVHKDHYIGFSGKTIYCDFADKNQAALELLGKTGAQCSDVVLMVTGADVSSDEADALETELIKAFKTTEIIRLDGGQPIFDYIFIIQ